MDQLEASEMNVRLLLYSCFAAINIRSRKMSDLLFGYCHVSSHLFDAICLVLACGPCLL
jgi:hypothetical protein